MCRWRHIRIFHDPVGVPGSVGVSAGLIGKAAGVTPGGDANQGAVEDEGGAIVATACVHQVVRGAGANFVEQQVVPVESFAFVGVDDRQVGLHERAGSETPRLHQSPAGHLSGRAGHHGRVLRQQADGGGTHAVQLYPFAS